MPQPVKRKYCYAFLPHAGLGNKLFVWAQCILFAKNNQCDYSVKGWYHLHVRTFLRIIFRGEKRHEYYFDPFKSGLLDNAKFLGFNESNGRFVSQVDSGKVIDNEAVFYFNEFNKDDHFVTLRDYRELISKVFWSKLKLRYIPSDRENDISIHIRRGDFVSTGWVSPLEYYKTILINIRKYLGFQVNAMIYSDGTREELADILNEPNTLFYNTVNPMYDLVSMSRSKLIILSANSTYGMWAAFLSEAAIIRKGEDFVKGYIRSEADRLRWYEGELNEDLRQWPDLLTQTLRKLQ
ncbi:MAG: alpha-1,2-fucosyltransferase [Chryseolinea sp.]